MAKPEKGNLSGATTQGIFKTELDILVDYLNSLTAANILNAPEGSIPSLNVQAAINYLDAAILGKVLAAGDVLYGTAAGTLARLPISANKKLYANSAGTALEYSTGLFAGSFSRDMATASGSVDYTGVGFKPTAVIFMARLVDVFTFSVGFQNAAVASAIFPYAVNIMSGSGASAIALYTSASNYQLASISSYNADGFTLGWSKTGSPTGSATIYYLALR